MPELCCRLETTTATETKDSGYVVAALAGGGLLTNLENATALTGRSVRRRGGPLASTFIGLSCDRNLADKNEPCGLPGAQFLQLEPQKE
jgi:hypothetical protein